MKVYPLDEQQQRAFEMLLRKKNERDYVLWMVGSHTGLRVSDIVRLKLSDVSGHYLRVTEQKTKKAKEIRISGKLKKAINDYTRNAGIVSGYLFPSRQNSSISIRRVQAIIKAAARLLGVERNINTHSMRKTFAYNLYRLSNNNLALVMQALNHSNQAVTLRYLGIDKDMIDNIVALF
ncbi:MAG: hypothetical protein ATN35_02125 [Epulopiscium sp. Nele67-Bin004]|nr:MAG: hypothetical protein ATN35_02125 [Epulopiscium sp. Nele67-Bin004]